MPVNLSTGFVIVRFSDRNYEKITTEIQFDGEQIAQINMDMGLDNLEIELFRDFINQEFEPKFKLKDFQEAIAMAVTRLEESS